MKTFKTMWITFLAVLMMALSTAALAQTKPSASPAPKASSKAVKSSTAAKKNSGKKKTVRKTAPFKKERQKKAKVAAKSPAVRVTKQGCSCSITRTKTKAVKTTKRTNNKVVASKDSNAAPKTPLISVTNADFEDTTLAAGEEKTVNGVVTFANDANVENYGTVFTLYPSGNLQAWFDGKTLKVFSPNGGTGRIIIFDKAEKRWDTIVISSTTGALAATEKTVNDLALKTGQALDTLVNYGWWILIFMIILAIISLLNLLTNWSVRSKIGVLAGRVEDIGRAVYQFAKEIKDNTAETNKLLRTFDDRTRLG